MEEHLTLQHSACRAVLCLSHCFMMNLHGETVQNYVTGYFITIITMAETDQFTIKIVTYNLHGLNNDRSGLSELCNDPDVDIIALQEHWLTPNKLHLLNEVHPDFTGFGISPMTDRLASVVYYGLPYGGIGFLWRKKLARTYIGYQTRSGRILSMMARRCCRL